MSGLLEVLFVHFIIKSTQVETEEANQQHDAGIMDLLNVSSSYRNQKQCDRLGNLLQNEDDIKNK